MAGRLVAGVAGAGVFGGYHAQKYAAHYGVRLGAIYDVDPTAAAALAGRFGATPYDSYQRFLEAVDIVTIAAPASAHFELAAQALKLGKDVLLEKPVATRLEDADQLLQLARASGAVLQAGHQERFVADALGILRRSRRPRSVWCRRYNARSGRGEDVSVVLDLMIHDLDLLHELDLGALTSVSAVGDADAAEAELLFSTGATAIVSASRTAPRADRRMTLVYDDGMVELDFIDRRAGNTTGEALAAALDRPSDNPALVDPLGVSVEKFVAACVSRTPSPIPGEAGRDALAWALEIEHALALRQPAPLRRASR